MSDKEQEIWDRFQKLDMREMLMDIFRPMAKEYLALRNDPLNSYFTYWQWDVLQQLLANPKPELEMTEQEQLVWSKYKYGDAFVEIRKA